MAIVLANDWFRPMEKCIVKRYVKEPVEDRSELEIAYSRVLCKL